MVQCRKALARWRPCIGRLSRCSVKIRFMRTALAAQGFGGSSTMPYLLGIDIGTSGTKTILIAESGSVVARSTIEYPLHSPAPLWSEQDPLDWWIATCGTVQSVLQQSGVSPREIAGIGLSGQMHGSVFLDENNDVIRPAILWNDQRTAA